jgi:hypothetical protein
MKPDWEIRVNATLPLAFVSGAYGKRAKPASTRDYSGINHLRFQGGKVGLLPPLRIAQKVEDSFLAPC